MSYYNDNIWVEALYWQDMFDSAEQFVEKVGAVGTDSGNLETLYDILKLKYMFAKTRYIEEEPFILGLKRELQIVWPVYLKQKELIEDMFNLELEEVMKVGSNLNNTVNTNDSPVVDADKIAISDLSTSQTSQLTRQGKLMALMSKYDAIRMDYVRMIYNASDSLFQKILIDNKFITYKQEV